MATKEFKPLHYVWWRIYSNNKDGSVNYNNIHFLKNVIFTRESIFRRHYYLNLVTAIFQIRFPKHRIKIEQGFKNKNTSDEIKLSRQISSTKAQITKLKNVLIEYNNKKKSELFFDEENKVLNLIIEKTKRNKEKLKKLNYERNRFI